MMTSISSMSLVISVFLLASGVICVVQRVRLSRLSKEDFPNVDSATFVRWRQIEVRHIEICLWISWSALVLQIAIVILVGMVFPRMKPGERDELEVMVSVLQLGYLFGSFYLLIACSFGEEAEQKKLRVEANVKSFYHPMPTIPSSGRVISAEPFAAEMDVRHVLGIKSKSLGFMSNTKVLTKSYRILKDLTLSPPKEVPVDSEADINESLYLICPNCGEQLASYVHYAVYARIPHGAIEGDSALKKNVARYILTHGLTIYWVVFLWTSILAGISVGTLLHDLAPWLTAVSFAVADGAFFVLSCGLITVFVYSKIRRRNTLLRFPHITRSAIPILEHKDIRPVVCVARVKIESAQGNSHELRMRNSTNDKRDSWGDTTITMSAADYGNFGLEDVYLPEVGYESSGGIPSS